MGRARIVTRAVLTAVHTLYETESDLYLDWMSWRLWLVIKQRHSKVCTSRHTLQRFWVASKAFFT